MILSRGKTDSAKSRQLSTAGGGSNRQKQPSLEEFLIKRDYVGAKAYLELIRDSIVDEDAAEGELQLDKEDKQLISQQWMAYCYFHLGDYQHALDEYTLLQQKEPATEFVHLNRAICMFYLGMYEDAEKLLALTPNTPLKLRLLYHLTFKLNNEGEQLSDLQKSLTEAVEDQLTIASLQYLQGHYQDATDIYKRIIMNNKDYSALNVYLALCFYKMDYYDMSQEILDVYLRKYPDSTVAINLKACNRFRLYSGRVAEQEIKNIADNGTFGADLIRHNLVVFRNGEGALKVFPGLLNIIPEARLNLAIYYLKNGNVHDAHELIKELQPNAPHEHTLKGVIYAALGQQLDSSEHIKTAQQNLHLVGNSATECDTIPGRQSMASAFFLYEQFEEVLVYMNSIRSYFINDDVFNYNYAQAKCATGYFKEAEDLLMHITDMDTKNQNTYCMTLAKCHIHAGRPEMAWSIYVARDTNNESFLLLQLIANECYKCGEFWISAKAFDMLEKLDSNPENWEGKRGACTGALYALATEAIKGCPENGVNDIISLLRDSHNIQADVMIKTIRKYINSFR